MKRLSETLVEYWDEGEHQRDHEAFKKWQVDHQKGYVLNFPPDDLRIFHKSGCPHVVNFTQSKPVASLTENRKLCSTDKDELLKEAGQARVDWRPCKTCSQKTHSQLW